jgi:hypothetical protein
MQAALFMVSQSCDIASNKARQLVLSAKLKRADHPGQKCTFRVYFVPL